MYAGLDLEVSIKGRGEECNVMSNKQIEGGWRGLKKQSRIKTAGRPRHSRIWSQHRLPCGIEEKRGKNVMLHVHEKQSGNGKAFVMSKMAYEDSRKDVACSGLLSARARVSSDVEYREASTFCWTGRRIE